MKRLLGLGLGLILLLYSTVHAAGPLQGIVSAMVSKTAQTITWNTQPAAPGRRTDMRRLIAALIILAVLVTCRSEAHMLLGCEAGSVSCVGSTGYTTVGANTAGVISNDYAWVFRYQADCSGILGTAQIWHQNTTASNVKVGIYNSTNADLNSDTGATLVGVSNSIAGGASTGWKTAAMVGSNSVTAGTWYWVAIFKESTGSTFNVARALNNALYSKTATGFYASPPANLNGGGWTNTASATPISCYVGVNQ